MRRSRIPPSSNRSSIPLERQGLKLMYASLIRASQSWQRVAINEFELRRIEDLKAELDE